MTSEYLIRRAHFVFYILSMVPCIGWSEDSISKGRIGASASKELKLLNYGGSVQIPVERGVAFTSYGAPKGLMPRDIAPDQICLEHITSLLDQFKAYRIFDWRAL